MRLKSKIKMLKLRDKLVTSLFKRDMLELHKRLYNIINEQSRGWKSFIYADTYFYQGLDRIGIKGLRPTEKRFKRYELNKFLKKEDTLLDIGSNCGFLVLYLTKFVKEADGVEINPYLTKISETTKEYLGIKNASFYTMGFEKFNPVKKYSIIMSLANDSTIDGNTILTFAQYVKKIYDLLQDKGILIFESQAIDTYQGTFESKKNILKKYFEIILKKMVDSDYPINVKNRIFLILKKK